MLISASSIISEGALMVAAAAVESARHTAQEGIASMSNPPKSVTVVNNSGATIDSIVICHAYDLLEPKGDLVYKYAGPLADGQTGPVVSLSDSNFHTGEDDEWYVMCNITDPTTGTRLAFMNSKGWKQDNVRHSDASITFLVKTQLAQYKYDANISVEPSDGSSPSDFWLEGSGHGGESPQWLGNLLVGYGVQVLKNLVNIIDE